MQNDDENDSEDQNQTEPPPDLSDSLALDPVDEEDYPAAALRGYLPDDLIERLQIQAHRRALALQDAPATPEKLAAESMAALSRRFAPEITAGGMVKILEAVKAEDGDGAELLRNQAHVMDALCHRLAIQSVAPEGKNKYNGEIIPEYISLAQADCAMRAQSLSRKAIEALSILKMRNKFFESKKT